MILFVKGNVWFDPRGHLFRYRGILTYGDFVVNMLTQYTNNPWDSPTLTHMVQIYIFFIHFFCGGGSTIAFRRRERCGLLTLPSQIGVYHKYGSNYWLNPGVMFICQEICSPRKLVLFRKEEGHSTQYYWSTFFVKKKNSKLQQSKFNAAT